MPASEVELFDVVSDPFETVNLADTLPEMLNRLIVATETHQIGKP
jgi:hypothetical protein